MKIIDMLTDAADAPALRQQLAEAQAEIDRLKAELATVRGELTATREGQRIYYELYRNAERRQHAR